MLNSNRWQNADEMFPEGGLYLDGKWVTNTQLQMMDIDEIPSFLMKPVRQMVEFEEALIYHSDGSMERFKTYSLYPPYLPDDISCLSVYGQAVYNNSVGNIVQNNNEEVDETEDENNDEIGLDYSNL